MTGPLHNDTKRIRGHRAFRIMVLCLLALLLPLTVANAQKGKGKGDDRVYLEHADELRYNINAPDPVTRFAQIVSGNVVFHHQGGTLKCDSAYFFQEANAVKAFGHVRYTQGDTLSLTCDHGDYDGQRQEMHARKKVVLRHRKQTLYTDSLNYDRLYEVAYFFEGGTLIDGTDKLVADWGEYHTDTRLARFFFNVKLQGEDHLITTDTLYYDTTISEAHVLGPSHMTSGTTDADTDNGYYATKTERMRLVSRSTIIDKEKAITADTLLYDKATGYGEAFSNVVYEDTLNRNALNCEYMQYDEQTGYGYATGRALVKDFSQGPDTLYMHADTLKLVTINIGTDSLYRKVHAYPHVRAYRKDLQAICDSLVFNSKDSCMTMYYDPIVWNGARQLLGERIEAYSNDSTIREAHVIGQALSIERGKTDDNYNQISSKEIDAYFIDGNIRRTVAMGNVKIIYYSIDDSDSSYIGLNYTETDTLKMYTSADRQLERIWTPKHQSTLYPMTQIPPEKYKLPEFVWFEELRPRHKDDIFEWRGKGDGNKLKTTTRRSAPLQTLRQNASPQATDSESDIPDKDAGEPLEEVSGETPDKGAGETPEEASGETHEGAVGEANEEVSEATPEKTTEVKQ